MIRGQYTRPMIVFTVTGGVFHLLWALQLTLLNIPLSAQGPLPGIVLTTALYEIIWAGIFIFPAIGELKKNVPCGTYIPLTFLEDYNLTRREAEILPLVCDGKTSRQIAEDLFISIRTVDTHIHNIYRKNGTTKRMELVNLLRRYS